MDKTGYKLSMFPLASCRIDGNIRVSVDDQELRLLGESLKKRQIHPIFVLSDGLVIDGSKRVRAATLAGLNELLAVVSGERLTAEEIRELQLISAFHRSDPSSFDKYQAMEAVKASHGEWSNKQIADLLDIDPKMVKILLSPSQCIEAAREALRDGRIGISVCHELSLLPLEQQKPLLDLKLAGVSRDEVARQARKQRNGSTASPAVRASRIKCLLPGGVDVVVSGPEMTIDELVDSLVELQKEARKARDQGLDAKTFQAVLRDRAKAAG